MPAARDQYRVGTGRRGLVFALHRPGDTIGILRTIFGKDTTTDVLELLELQHKQVDERFERIESSTGTSLVIELADNLGAHATVEEQVFYPAVMAKDTNTPLHESVEEHSRSSACSPT